MRNAGIMDREYPIQPNHINTHRLFEGHLADFTISNGVIAAIISLSSQNRSWEPIKTSDVELFLVALGRADRTSDDFWKSIYEPFYVVKDGCVQLTHECIAECFKKFPSTQLNVEQNSHSLLS